MRRTSWRLAVASLMAALSLVVPATSASAGIPLDQAAKIASHASQMSLAKAPAALTRAVRVSLPDGISRQDLSAPGSESFGYSVAVSGATALIGAPGNNNLAGRPTCSPSRTGCGHSKSS